MISIKGKYEFDIIIQNMFHTYEIVIKNHNLVTNKGMELILKCALGESDEHLGNVWVGTNGQEAEVTDTKDVFDSGATELTNPTLSYENNVLTYTLVTTGSNINGTREIGIFGDDEDNPTLVTRDVHDRYDIPPNAQITLKYMLIFTNVDNEELEEEEIIND